MANVAISGDTSGAVTLFAPAVSGTTTLTLPTTSGTVLTSASSITASQLPAGTIKQVVVGSDATAYTLSITGGSGGDTAGSTAFTITPTSSSATILIQFFIPQIKIGTDVGGLRVRLYRSIAGGAYTRVTSVEGTPSGGNRQGGLAGNYNYGGDGNRSSLWIGGTISDTPATTSSVAYKFYYSCGDSGGYTVNVNRTGNDTDNTYTTATKTAVTLMEISV
jgi:hypothetical protein